MVYKRVILQFRFINIAYMDRSIDDRRLFVPHRFEIIKKVKFALPNAMRHDPVRGDVVKSLARKSTRNKSEYNWCINFGLIRQYLFGGVLEKRRETPVVQRE